MEGEPLLNQPVSVKTCVLYDPSDGRVVHTHRVVTMPGGQESNDEEVAERAGDCAKRMGHETNGLHVLHVGPDDCDGVSQYRVDLTAMNLQKIPRPDTTR